MDKRRVWLSPRALRLHAVILIVVPAFLALCVWQIMRALGGNSLSWAYVFEWPLFAGYAVYMWWRFVHEGADETRSARSTDGRTATDGRMTTEAPAPTPTPAPDGDAGGHDGARASEAPPRREDDEDAELAAYNEYLAQLAERDKATER